MTRVDSVLSIDPGTSHCGMANFTPPGAGGREVGHPSGWGVYATYDKSPVECLEHVEDWFEVVQFGVLVVEGFQLYPNMLQQQGLSRMGTPEVIGALKWAYIRAGHEGIAFYEQGASVKLTGCEFMGGGCHHEMVKGKKTWVHDTEAHTGSNIHKRDAEAHGWYRVRKITEGRW